MTSGLALLTAAALALASCTDASRSPYEIARVEARADSLYYVDARNRVAADSGIVYEYRPCASYTFDSESGLLVRRGRAGGPDTLHTEITSEEFKTVVAEAERMGLWSYPAAFGEAETVSFGSDSMMNVLIPSASYRLDLRAGGKSASVRWSERIKKPLSPEAEQLRALARQIERYIGAESAYSRFPDLEFGCL